LQSFVPVLEGCSSVAERKTFLSKERLRRPTQPALPTTPGTQVSLLWILVVRLSDTRFGVLKEASCYARELYDKQRVFTALLPCECSHCLGLGVVIEWYVPVCTGANEIIERYLLL